MVIRAKWSSIGLYLRKISINVKAFNQWQAGWNAMKETRKRSILKSIVWRLICIVVSILTSFILTGKWDIAVAIGTIYNAITMILYYFHERLWNRINWGYERPLNEE